MAVGGEPEERGFWDRLLTETDWQPVAAAVGGSTSTAPVAPPAEPASDLAQVIQLKQFTDRMNERYQ